MSDTSTDIFSNTRGRPQCPLLAIDYCSLYVYKPCILARLYPQHSLCVALYLFVAGSREMLMSPCTVGHCGTRISGHGHSGSNHRRRYLEDRVGAKPPPAERGPSRPLGRLPVWGRPRCACLKCLTLRKCLLPYICPPGRIPHNRVCPWFG